MKLLPINIRSFFDRNYNLIFRRGRCIQLLGLKEGYREYNLVIISPGSSHTPYLRCLGKDWYISIDKLKPRKP